MRKFSWALIAVALVAPFVWAYFAIQADAEAQLVGHPRFVCGIPMLGIVLVACAASGILSVISTIVGLVAYLRLNTPRPKLRMLELCALSVPLLLSAAFLISEFGDA